MASNALQDIIILPMSEHDIDEILKIEDRAFPIPWSRSQFQKELKNPYSLSFAARLNKRSDRTLIGYIIVWLVAEEAHILNIAVHPDFRGMGFGKRILIFVLDELIKRNARAVYLEVRASNIVALRLYKGFGFTQIGIRKGYYSDNKEDAVVMGLEMKNRLKGEG